MRWHGPALGAAVLAVTAGCTVDPGRYRPMEPAGFARSTSWGDHEQGAADLRIGADIEPGEQIQVPAKLTFDVDGRTAFFAEWAPLAYKDRASGWRAVSGSEIVYGVQERVFAPSTPDTFVPAFSASVFGVAPHGGPKTPRWQGVVENQEGWFALGAFEWNRTAIDVVANLGFGLAGRPGRAGRSGRVLGGLAATYALPATGIDLSTEPSRIGLETFWVHDPIDDRTFGELGLGVSFWVGTIEVDLGYRRGLTSETTDDVVYLGFRTRALDTLSLAGG